MIVRIVTLHIKEERVDEFEALSSRIRERILSFPGCTHLEFLRDIVDKGLFVTCSVWEKEEDLERYRASELFADIWPEAKDMFSKKPVLKP
jgi:quinol monooxygenase YgiN